VADFEPDYSLESAHLAIAELRVAWSWLALLVVPGPESRPGQAVDDGFAEVLAAQGMAARAYREWNLRRGLTALAPTGAPARLAVVDVQANIHGLVTEVARRVAAALHACYVGGRTGAAAAVVDALDWLTDGGPGSPWITGVDGVWGRRGKLDELRDRTAIASVARALQRANRIARETAGVVADPVLPLGDRCPACRRRSLQLRYDPADLNRVVVDELRPREPSRWYAECVSEQCRCTVEGCGCGMRMRVHGRRHAWSYGELPDLARTIARAAPISQPVRRSATGRGWGILGV
jgi:hypothetical protein